jgi:hypothetical protein
MRRVGQHAIAELSEYDHHRASASVDHLYDLLRRVEPRPEAVLTNQNSRNQLSSPPDLPTPTQQPAPTQPPVQLPQHQEILIPMRLLHLLSLGAVC